MSLAKLRHPARCGWISGRQGRSVDGPCCNSERNHRPNIAGSKMISVKTVDAYHDIHRPAVVIEKLLTTGKGGVSYEVREAGKVGHGNDRGVVVPTAVE